MRVLISPDTFKGSLTSLAAARAMQEGAVRVFPRCLVRLLPIADGGDGSVDALILAGYDALSVPTRGPTGRPAIARIAIREGGAVVEIANACGLLLLPDAVPAPMESSSLGLGDAIIGALDAGAGHVVVCLGGSASTDGGAGMLAALGVRLRDASGRDVRPCGGTLSDVARVDLAGLDPRVSTTAFTVATDVTSPLLGPAGAAAVFAPQKGATPAQAAQLEAGLAHWAGLLERATGADVSVVAGAGAAGGVAAACLAVLGADLVSGAEFIQSALGLERAVRAADVVVTGEGSLDRQSLLGKGAISVARSAKDQGVPVVAVCGRIDLGEDELAALGIISSSSLVSLARDGGDAIRRAAELLPEATAAALRALRSD